MRDAITIIKTKIRDCLTHPDSSVRSYARALTQELEGKPAESSRPCETIVQCYQHPSETIKRLTEHLFQALSESEKLADQNNQRATTEISHRRMPQD